MGCNGAAVVSFPARSWSTPAGPLIANVIPLSDMTKADIDAIIRDDWRALEFYYTRDDTAREWRLVGSRDGLRNFSRILIGYTNNPRNDFQSEHDHLGPYMYLKIMTWPDAGIGQDAIHGTLADLRRLAAIVDDSIAAMQVGETARIQSQFVPDAEYAIILDARADETDPSAFDPELPKTIG